MKNLTTSLLLVSAFTCAAPSIASAVDVSVDGEYLYQFQTGSLDFADSHEDSHQQRVRLGLTFSASEHLSGYFQTESVWEWGSNDDAGGSGTAFDGAAVNVNMRQAYIDWMVPGTSVKVRMGRHAYDLPSFTSTSSMIADMVGDGIVVDMPFGDAYGLTAFWTRMARNGGTDTHFSKEFDLFGLVGSVKYENLSVAPWVVYGSKGKGVEGDRSAADFENPLEGQGNITGDAHADVYVGGIGAEWAPFGALTLAADAAFGRTEYSEKADPALQDQEGWYVIGKAAYNLGFGEPALLAWYASGDKKGDQKYAGHVPTIFGDFDGSSTYFDAACGIFGGNRTTLGGSWGVSAQLNGVSFIDAMTHDFSITYFAGTNHKTLGGYGSGYDYLTTEDSGVEFDMTTTYEIYKNLSALLELAYIIEDFDTSVENGRDGDPYDDAWRVALHFQYTF